MSGKTAFKMATELSDAEKIEFARRFTDLYLAGDAEAVGAMIANDFALVVNTGYSCGREAFLKYVAEFFPALISISYTDVRRTATTSGFVQQHVVNSAFQDGRVVQNLHVCLVAIMHESRISHIDEYMDGTQLPNNPAG
jgi:hypothetical protein